MAEKKVATELIDVKLILIDDELRGRNIKPIDDDVAVMAASIKESGQLHEIRVRPIEKTEEGQQYVCVYGSTRCEAIKLLNGKGGKLKVRAQVLECSEEDAFSATVRENLDRSDTNCVDDAYNQNRMRENYEKTNAEIAKFYNCSKAWVTMLKRLLNASAPLKAAIAKGHITPTAAMDVVGTGKGNTAKEQKAILDAATQDTKKDKITRASVRQLSAPATPTDPVSPSNKSLNASKIRAAFAECCQEGWYSDDATFKDLCAAMLEFIDGKKKFPWLIKQVDKYRSEPMRDEDDGDVESGDLTEDNEPVADDGGPTDADLSGIESDPATV